MNGDAMGGGSAQGLPPQGEGGGIPAAPGPADVGTPAAAAPAPGVAPEPMVDIGGEQVPLSEVQAWKSGHLMQKDYTQKTQALAASQRQLQPYMELADYLQGNPQAVEAIEKALSEEGIAGQPAPQVPDPRYSQMEDRLLDTEYRMEAMQFQAAYPQANAKQVTEFAIAAGIPSLEAAYKVMAYDQMKQGQAQMLSQNVAQKQGAAIEQQYGSQPPPTQEIDVTGMSLEDRIRAGIKKYGPLTT